MMDYQFCKLVDGNMMEAQVNHFINDINDMKLDCKDEFIKIDEDKCLVVIPLNKAISESTLNTIKEKYSDVNVSGYKINRDKYVHSIRETIDYAVENNISFADIMVKEEMELSGKSRDEVRAQMKQNLDVMRDAVIKGTTGDGVEKV